MTKTTSGVPDTCALTCAALLILHLDGYLLESCSHADAHPCAPVHAIVTRGHATDGDVDAAAGPLQSEGAVGLVGRLCSYDLLTGEVVLSAEEEDLPGAPVRILTADGCSRRSSNCLSPCVAVSCKKSQECPE